ncbi:MAG: hypothetical protein ABJ331_21615 [Marinobacter sp.]|uniref:hypothetical protein n=1 Tax=Marinobacter sp. TaxID=50741 RepID=UPI003299163D
MGHNVLREIVHHFPHAGSRVRRLSAYVRACHARCDGNAGSLVPSLQVFQTFSCEDYDEIEKSYLRADNRIECYTDTHNGYRMYAMLMIILCESEER